MSKKEVLKRYFIFLIGIYINSFGISFITKAALGTSPISSVPYVLSLGFWPTMGEFTIALSLLLILLQIALLGKKFKKASLLQIPVSIVFGYFIDWSMLLLEWVDPQEYLMKILFLLIGCVVLGFGVFLEVAADVVMLPGEAFVQAVTIRFRTDFGITKVCFDASMAGSALVISLILFHGVIGVREGTIVAALTVGLIAKLFGKALKKTTAKLLPAQVREAVPEYEETGTPHRIITIGREFGSGGREVGKLVAEKLGIAYYDSEVIRRAAEENDYSEQYIRNNEEKLPDARLYDLYTQYYSYGAEEKPKYEALFQVEQKVMKELAEKNSCVIVGRASGYVFRKYKTALHVFISAGMQHKIDRVVRRDGLDPKEAEKKIKKVAIERKNHCKYFTGRDWGMAENYDLALRTDAFSVEDVADTIIKMSDKKLRAQ